MVRSDGDAPSRQRLGWMLAGLGLGLAALVWLRWPEAAPAPPALPVVAPEPPPPPVAVAEPEAPVAAAPAGPPAPPAPAPSSAPAPPPAAVPVAAVCQLVVLADGRTFIGHLDRSAGTMQVLAAVRGGVLSRMPALAIAAPASAVTSCEEYDGRWGPVQAAYQPPPARPEVEEARQRARADAEVRAGQRRAEAAERERRQREAARRASLQAACDNARARVAAAERRDGELAERARSLEDDRRAKRDLVNGLQLQLNEAQDRWNRESQERKDGDTGPTPATRRLVAQLQRQIVQARQDLAGIERSLREGADERTRIRDGMPALQEAVRAADAVADADSAAPDAASAPDAATAP